jgi:lysophospholipase L1-like esterase
VQYRLISDTFNTTPANWQGVDDVPTAGYNNLVKSGGVYSYTKEQVNTNETVSSFADKDIVTYYTVGERLLQNLFYVNAGDVVHLVTLNHTPYAIFLRVLDFNNVKVQEIYSYNPSQGIEMEVTDSGLLQVEEPAANTIKNVIRVYVENKKYALDKSISNIETNKLNAENSINLFNPETVISGEFVGSNGTIYQEPSWSLSDYIEIEPGQSYYRTGANALAAWYDQDKQYIENTTNNNIITSPSVAKYIRVSCPISGLNSYMICKGNAAVPYQKYGSFLSPSSLSDEIFEEISSKLGLKYFNLLLEHLSNPFIKTQIKLLGDSITAGVGGTGYSATGEIIAGGSTKANVLTATCWSNMLYHFMIDTYAKEWEINFENKELEGVNASLVSSYNIGTQAKPNNTKAYFFYSPNTEISACKFNFYGTSFSIRHTVGASNGIFSVYVDNVLYQTIDTYAAESNKVITEITGLTEGVHNVEIKINGSKNASSSGTTVILIGFKVRKYITFHPWGIGGTTSSTPIIENMLSQDDNFVFIEYGTNDRIVEVSVDSLYSNLIKLGESVKSIGAYPIFMCAPPVSESQETDGEYTYWFTMTDVQNIVLKVAKHFNIPFIDNYKAFIDYADQHSVLFDTLLADGLHPNDSGYKVMYNNIMETLGIARQPYYREWSGEN